MSSEEHGFQLSEIKDKNLKNLIKQQESEDLAKGLTEDQINQRKAQTEVALCIKKPNQKSQVEILKMNKEERMDYLKLIGKQERGDIIKRFKRTMKRLRFVDKFAL